MEENRAIFSSLEEEAYDLISVMSKTSQLKQLKKICQREEGGTNMCKAIDDMIEDGRAAGRIEGERQGRIEGERRGRIDGEQQGIALTKRVFKLSGEGKSFQEIAELCGISIKKVQLILE